MKDGSLKQFQNTIKVFNQLRKSGTERLVLLRSAINAHRAPSQVY